MSKIFYQSNIHKNSIPISVIVILGSDCSIENFLSKMSNQTHKFFEIFFVGKNITNENVKRIEAFTKQTGIPSRNIIGKKRIGLLLNEAIIATANSFIVFLKSKYSPQPNFLSALIQSRFEKDLYTIAGTEKSLRSKILRMHTFKRLNICHIASKLLRKTTLEGKYKWSWSGTGCWKKDLIAVNGFNERLNANLGEELRVRLNNIGVLGRKVLTYSVKHEENIKQCNSIFVSNLDEKMYIAAQRNKLDWSSRGIDSVG